MKTKPDESCSQSILFWTKIFIFFTATHLFVNIFFLKANHFPFVALGPDDFSNLNYPSPFVSARPFSYLLVYLFSQTGELGFFILLNMLLALTCTLAFTALSNLTFNKNNDIQLAIIPFAILLSSWEFASEYTRLTGLVPNLLSVSLGYLSIITLCNESKFNNKKLFLLTIALLQGLGALAKEDFFHIPIVIATFLHFTKPCNTSDHPNIWIKVITLSIPPLICIYLQKNSSAFLQGIQNTNSELSPNFHLENIFSAFKYYLNKYFFFGYFEVFLCVVSTCYFIIKKDINVLLLLLTSLLCRFPYLLLHKHLLTHYFVNWAATETFLACYLIIKARDMIAPTLPSKAYKFLSFLILIFLICVPKLTSKKRATSIAYYRPLAKSHSQLYLICKEHKNELNNCDTAVVIGNTKGYDLRSTPFDDKNAIHLEKMGVKPKKWIRFLDIQRFPEAINLLDWFGNNNIPCNIVIKSETDALSICKKNKWPCIYYKDDKIIYYKN